jgi:BASS family bile acid:Na+ symporter
MQSSVFTAVLLPLVLASIMFGMGLSLQKKDFSRLLKVPKPIFLGLFGQLLLLPALAFSIAVLTNASEEVAIGLMILSVCPGGTTSNLFAHLARANLALSISLTAITTIICVFTTPLMIAFSIDYFSESAAVQFSLLSTSLGLMVITLLPVLLGMFVRKHYINFALQAEPIFRKLAIVFMILLIVKISYDERDMIVAGFPNMYIVALSLNILATLLGVFLAKLFLLDKRDGVTLGIEIGTQNATLAILIALSFVQIPAYAVIPGIYGLLMYVGASLLVLYSKSKNAI